MLAKLRIRHPSSKRVDILRPNYDFVTIIIQEGLWKNTGIT